MKDKVVEVVEKPKPSVMPALYSGDSWELKDQRARGILIEHLNDRLVLELQGLTTAKEMYDKIVDIHQNTNIGVNAFYTFAGMLNLKWDGDQSTLDNHIAAIKSGDAKLSGMKKPIDAEFLAFLLLNSLPDDSIWETFRTTILNSIPNNTTLSFADIASRLASTASLQAKGTPTSESALKAKSSHTSSSSSRKPKSQKWCTHHNSSTHNTEDRFALKKKETEGGKKK